MGAQGEDAAAAAEIAEAAPRCYQLFQCFDAELGGGVGSGAEGGSRINLQNRAAFVVVNLFPARFDHELFTDAKGLKILFPVVFPIFLTHRSDCQLQRAEKSLVVAALQVFHHFFHDGKLFFALFVGSQIQLDGAFLVLLRFQKRLVNIVPARCVGFQKFLKIRSIFNDEIL